MGTRIWLKRLFSSNFYWSLLYIISMVTTEVQYSHCHPPSSILGSTPLHLDVQRLRLELTGAPGLDRPLHGRVDPAVIEEIRLVLPNCIRLGGPKTKIIFEGKTREHRTAPGKKWCPQLDICTEKFRQGTKRLRDDAGVT